MNISDCFGTSLSNFTDEQFKFFECFIKEIKFIKFIDCIGYSGDLLFEPSDVYDMLVKIYNKETVCDYIVDLRLSKWDPQKVTLSVSLDHKIPFYENLADKCVISGEIIFHFLEYWT